MRKRVWVLRSYSMTKRVADLVDYLSAVTNMNKSEFIRAAIRCYAKEVEKNGGGK